MRIKQSCQIIIILDDCRERYLMVERERPEGCDGGFGLHGPQGEQAHALRTLKTEHIKFKFWIRQC